MTLKSIMIASALLLTSSQQAVWAASACAYSDMAGKWEIIANNTDYNFISRCKITITSQTSSATGSSATCTTAYSYDGSVGSTSVSLGASTFTKTTVSSCSFKVTFRLGGNSSTAYVTMSQGKDTLSGAWLMNSDDSQGGTIIGTNIP